MKLVLWAMDWNMLERMMAFLMLEIQFEMINNPETKKLRK